MLPYFLLIFIFFIVFIVVYKSTNKFPFVISLWILCFFAGIRNYTIGSDTPTYVYNFINNTDVQYYVFNDDVEKGYQVFEYIVLSLTHEYFWFLFIASIIVVSLYLIAIKKLSIDYYTSLYIYICFGFYTFFFNGLRQGIAMAICFFGLPYLIEKRIISYFLVVFIASLFHVSALVMLPIYFLVNLKFKLEFKVLACLITSILASQILIEYFAQSNVRYEHYTQEAEQAGGYITLAFYFFIGLVVYFTGHKIRNQDIKFNKFEQILLCGLALVFPITFLGTDPSGPQRILYYFVSTVILLIPYILRKFNNIYLNILFIIFVIIYFILTTMRFSNLYPYQINPIFGVF